MRPIFNAPGAGCHRQIRPGVAFTTSHVVLIGCSEARRTFYSTDAGVDTFDGPPGAEHT